MSKKSKLSLDDHNKLDENLTCVDGLLSLLSAAFTGDITFVDSDKMYFLINDMQGKIKEVREFVEILEKA
jgi:hypothetical protein